MNDMIRDGDIDQVRDRANIIDIISQHMTLKKAGRTYKGLCPFHSEKTPSFTVDPVKQLYHCFGCGEGGDIFSFIMKTEGLNFGEAVESLAKKVGYTIQFQKKSRDGDIKSRLYESNEAAAGYFAKVLMTSAGTSAREYLKSRGFDRKDALDARIGYAPDSWDSLKNYLEKAGFKDDEMIRSGVVSKGEHGKVYDRFRGRLMFPITDIQGRVVAFGGRIIGDGSPKYLNSPETSIYNKSAVLYGLAQAKTFIIKDEAAIVVEGYTDRVSLARAGIANAVATCGTAFTADHLRLLSRFTDKIILVFDGDEAGISAAERGREHISHFLLPSEESLKGIAGQGKVGVKVLILPEKADPADLIAKKGAGEFERLLKTAVPFTDFYLDRIFSRHDLKESDGRRRALEQSLDFIASLSSAVDREDYLKKVADRAGVAAETLRLDFRRNAGPGYSGKSNSGMEAGKIPIKTASGVAEKEMLKLTVQFPEKSAYLLELEDNDWRDPKYKHLFTVLKEQQVGKGKLDMESVLRELPFDLVNLVSELSLEPILADDRERYFLEIFLCMKEFSLDRQIKQMIADLGEVGDDQESKGLEERLFALQRQRREIRKQIV